MAVVKFAKGKSLNVRTKQFVRFVCLWYASSAKGISANRFFRAAHFKEPVTMIQRLFYVMV